MKKCHAMETMQKKEIATEVHEAEDQVKLGIAKAASALTFIAGLNGGWLGPLIPQIAGTQKLPLEKVGLIVSLLCAGCFVTQLIGPKILNRLGGKGSLLAGSALLAAGMLGLATGHLLEHLLAAAFVTGLGTGLNGISGHVCILNFFKERAASALSRLNIFYGVGALLAPQIVLYLNLGDNTFRYIFATNAVLTCLCTLYLLRLPQAARDIHIDKSSSHDAEATTTSSAGALLTPSLVLMCLTIFFYVGMETSTGAWLFTYLHQTRNLSAAICTQAVSLLWCGLTVGRLISIKASLKYPPLVVTSLAMLVAVCAVFIVSLFSLGESGALICSALIGLGCGPIYPQSIAQTAQLLRHKPRLVATATSFGISSGAVGGIVMPGVCGQILVHQGAVPAMLTIGGVSLAMAVMYIAAQMAKKRQNLFERQ